MKKNPNSNCQAALASGWHRCLHPFHIDGGEGPAERAAERIKHEERQAAGKQRPDQSRRDRRRRGRRRAGEFRRAVRRSISQAQQRRPDRHRIGDDDGARGRAVELRESRTESGTPRHCRKPATMTCTRSPRGTRKLWPAEQGRGEQRRRADAGAGKAQAPRRHFAQRHRRGDPVEAPGKGEQHDQKLGRARQRSAFTAVLGR